MKCKGAIFDMDGLLFDTERIFQETWQELAETCQVELADGFVRAISGTNGEHMCRVIEEYYHVPDGNLIMEACMSAVKKKLEIHVPVQEGVTEILQYFRENGIKMAVASSSAREQIKANLENAWIEEYFEEIVSGAEVRHGKPEPDIFLRAAEKIGCRPEECFVFEDSENGIKAGYAAGCVTVMIPDLIAPSSEIVPYCSHIYENLLHAMQEIKSALSY